MSNPPAISITSPIDGSVHLTSLVMDTPSTLESKLSLAARAHHELRRTAFTQRALWLSHAADLLEHEADRLAAIMTLEMGKTLASARAEVLKCATVCRYYATYAESMLADSPISTSAKRCFVRYQPLGVILAVMPWNFPLWQVFRFAAPALMAGNTGVLKHAANVPQCAHAIEDILLRAGFPAGSFQALYIDIPEVATVIADPRIAAVTVTGSEAAGASVASIAAQHIKKAVLELGGSDPFIIMPSADLERAIPAAVDARMINAGQSCIAAKRFLVHDAIYDRCEREILQSISKLRVGDPRDPNTQIAPMATARLASALHAQVLSAVAAGARVLTGGRFHDRGSCYYEPTLLVDVPRGSNIAHQEFFGPVAMLFRVHDLADAIALANGTPFGLSASVWTQNEPEQQRFIEDIEAGQVFLNTMTVSDSRVPFGGIKRSGFGRELGAAGIHEFVNMKSIICN